MLQMLKFLSISPAKYNQFKYFAFFLKSKVFDYSYYKISQSLRLRDFFQYYLHQADITFTSNVT